MGHPSPSKSAGTPRHLLLLAALAALLASGCMLSPNDGDVVADPVPPMTFSGYDPDPDTPIEIQAWDILEQSWKPVAWARSSATPYRYWDGTDLYEWSVSVYMGPFWQPGNAGYLLRLRARRNGTGEFLYTFPSSWGTCLNTYPEVEDFVVHCASPNSPEAFLYTSQYPTTADFYMGVISLGGRGLLVDVFNFGRHGTMTRLECAHARGGITLSVNRVFKPGDRVTFDVGLPSVVGDVVTCTVFGKNADGTPEPVTCTNGVCGNNTRIRTLR